MNVLRKLILSFVFYSKIASFSFFQNSSKSFRKPIFFDKEAQILWTFWENCQLQIKINSNFNAKPLYLFYNSQKFERSEISYTFSCFLQQILYLSPFLKISRFFSENPFFIAKTQFLKFWEISLFRSHSTSNWLSLAVFKNSNFFFEKPI